MKRFLLFSWDDFYPAGGWHDFSRDFDSAQEAFDAADAENKKRDNVQIIDLQSGKEINRSDMI